MVGLEEIARVTSLWSGIRQDDAVVAISRAVKRSRTGMSDPDRPIATLLFCGPTGVGKTELTKALASTYFGSVGHSFLVISYSTYRTCYIEFVLKGYFFRLTGVSYG